MAAFPATFLLWLHAGHHGLCGHLAAASPIPRGAGEDRICATAADPVPIANHAGATYLFGPVPEGIDSCILSGDGNNATRTGTWDFGPIGDQITVFTFSSQADYDSQLAAEGYGRGSGGYGSAPDRVVVIPGKLAIIETTSPVTVASRVGGQVITPQPPPSMPTPVAVTPPP